MKIAKDTVVSLNYELIDLSGNTLLEKSNDPISYVHGGYDGIFPTVGKSWIMAMFMVLVVTSTNWCVKFASGRFLIFYF